MKSTGRVCSPARAGFFVLALFAAIGLGAAHAQNEPILVQTHLHLMAVMKQVYLKLGRSEQLKEIIARDSAAPNPAYRRAWQIVNDIEGHQAFVAELRR